jgi:hypothetical protein
MSHGPLLTVKKFANLLSSLLKRGLPAKFVALTR